MATTPTHPLRTTGAAAVIVGLPNGPMRAGTIVAIVDSVNTCVTTPRTAIPAQLALADITTLVTITGNGAILHIAKDARSVQWASPMALLQQAPTTTVPHVTMATTPDGLEIFATGFHRANTLPVDTNTVVRQGNIAGTMITHYIIARVVQEARSMVAGTALTVTGIAKAAQVERLHQVEGRAIHSR